MGTRESARDRGQRQARALVYSIGQELRQARIAAGLSQAHVARAAGLWQSRISKTERAEPPFARVDELALHCAALGYRLASKAYPEGSPVRDAPQLDLISGLRAIVSNVFRWRTEVGLDIPGDRRAWDVWLDGPGVVAIDAETRIGDMQSLQRKLELKLRDSGSPRLVLVVSDTQHNRRVIREHRAALASTLPLDTREVLAALRQGEVPRANGIAFVRPASWDRQTPRSSHRTSHGG
jgi:transcriptional regulator with XRE-family HTH domain